MSSQSELLQSGLAALKQKRFEEAIAPLEKYLQNADPATPAYLQAQVWLAKAYRGNRQTEAAIALTRELTNAADPMVQTWAQQFLTAIAATAVLQTVAPEAVPQLLGGAAAEQPVGKTGAANNASPRRLLKSVDQLRNFYQRHLIKDLKAVERDRKTYLNQFIAVAVTIAVLFTIPVLYLFGQGLGILAIPIYAIAYLAIRWYLSYIRRSYVNSFKLMNVVEKIVQGINPDLSHSPYASVKHSFRSIYHDSQLFQHLGLPDYFREEDVVSGQVGDVAIAFAEIHAEKEQEQGRSSTALEIGSALATGNFWGILFELLIHFALKQNSQSKQSIEGVRQTLFKGILFVADFNKNFDYKTVVLPDVAERYLGGLGQAFQSLNGQHGQLVKLEDPEFEKLFAVYSGNQVEARYILSTNLMERLVRFRKKSGYEISVSFVNRSIYVAIAIPHNLFEPRLFQSMLSFQPIQEYFENLQLAIGIAEDLKLNRRIWSRE